MNRYDICRALHAHFGDNTQYILPHLKDSINFWTRYVPANCANESWATDEKGLHDIIVEAERLNDHLLTPLTAKVGDGATVKLLTDCHACTIIKVTKTTVTVRYDKAILNPDFKPEWVVGGFSAHCTNSEEQTYTYEPDENGNV